MNLGNSLFHARKKCGLSQEEVAEKLGVSRQTISKWETNETVPDIYQSKKMAKLYHIALDDLIEFDVELSEIQEIIEKTDEKIEERIDWTSAWGKKYPVLLQYQQEVNVPDYARRINLMLNELKTEYQFNEQDAMLVLKDILYRLGKHEKKHKGLFLRFLFCNIKLHSRLVFLGNQAAIFFCLRRCSHDGRNRL